MRNNSFFKIIVIVVMVVFFASCDKDFNSIGGDLIGNEHFGLEAKNYDVLSYNQKIGPVQSNNLAVNALGIYDDPVFGTTEASFVTQVVLASVNPTIGANPVIENVVLNIPYSSSTKSTDAATGNNTYTLNNIYGPETGKIKLSVYENGYFMRDLDPLTGFLQTQNFYTDQGVDFDGLKKTTLLNNDASASQNNEFFFDDNEFRVTTTTDGVTTTERTPPAMRLLLDKAYFKTAIIDAAASGKLATNDVFKNHFRGLYFKVEKSGSSPGRLAMLDFTAGTVTVNYKEDLVVSTTLNGSTTTTTTRVDKSIILNMVGVPSAGLSCNTVSLISNDLSNASVYDNAANNPNTTAGDEKLYLKGGEGALAVLDLFKKEDVKGYDSNGNLTNGPNGVPDELDDLRNPEGKKKLLINEANLVFHVDEATMGENKLPGRIYLYDLNNHRPILDYAVDAESGFLVYGGLLNATKVGNKTYKFRITNHIRNLINNKDSINVKLGIVVTDTITNSTMNKLRLPLRPGTTLTQAPQGSIVSPLGVVLYGGKSSVPEDKRLKLEIYYTKPN